MSSLLVHVLKDVFLYNIISNEEIYLYQKSDIWLYYKESRNYELKNKGFKIHISLTLGNYKEILNEVLPLLNQVKVKYKIISSVYELENLNSGIYGITQIGKGITIYPENELELNTLLEKIYIKTKIYRSIEIISDFKYKNSEVVYYRYGEIVYNKKNKDKRIKKIPKGIKIPIEFHNLKNNEENYKRYKVVKILNYRGKSNVCLVLDKEEQKFVIMKEGKFLGEISDDKIDGFDKILKEYKNLKILSKTNLFPKVLDVFYHKNNIVLIEEYIKGEILFDYMIKITRKIKKEKLNEILEKIMLIHKKGYVFNDISPANIIVSNDNIKFIDLEYLDVIGCEKNLYGTPGFYSSKYIDRDRDIYSFLCLIYWSENIKKYKNIIKNNKSNSSIHKKLNVEENIENMVKKINNNFWELEYEYKIKELREFLKVLEESK